MKKLIVAAISTVLVVGAHAQVRMEKDISLLLAAEIAQKSIQSCAAKGYNVTATVVDRAGSVRAVLRLDNSGPHTVDASRRKAYTAVSTKQATSAMLENVQKNPGAQFLPDITDFLVVAGGLPIKSGNEVIGAVGVGGAPSGQLDEQCAADALKQVESKLQ